MNKQTNREGELPEDEVKVKVSLCPKCNGMVRAAVVHAMTIKGRNEFMREVMEHDLSVKTISLTDFRAGKIAWCEC